MQQLYDQYLVKMKKLADVHHAIGVLSWDKEVYLPKQSAKFRSQQVATLTGIAHEIFTDKAFGESLEKLNDSDSLDDAQKRNIKLSLKEYKKSTLFDESFVIEKSQLVSEAYHAWIKAKAENNFQLYVEPLDRLIKKVKEEAKIIGYKEHPYDALLDIYEPNMTVRKLDELFEGLKAKLIPLIKKITAAQQVDNSFNFKHYDKDTQWDFGIEILKSMGYNMDMGRQDISTHPFTISFSPEDVRVTTRIDESDMANMLWSCIHEGGHALYEQGLPAEHYGTPLGAAVSLGIHESQSRLWENHVGRSLPFWNQNYPKLQAQFRDQLGQLPLNDFYKGINKVAPNLIRTEADELHYHLHVIIRYELEKELMEGKIETKDLSQAWNDKYLSYLGMEVPDDNQGILQDIHWAHGSIGYFPTYSIGSLYAAQFYQQAIKDIPEIESQISNNDSSQLLKWLREKIHQHGHRYDANELCKQITGEELNVNHFIKYAELKYSDVYNVVLN